MRELVVENQEVMIIPQNYRFANKGIVKSVSAGEFIMEMKYPPENILLNAFCEFYTQTSHGKLFFESYVKEINGNELLVASPSKHKFLQRRQYTRIKFTNDIDVKLGDDMLSVKPRDISAGGLKFAVDHSIDIDGVYNVSVPLESDFVVNCIFKPIRIEKKDNDYTVSGQFEYNSTQDKMLLVQYCTKRNVEIVNK